MLRLNLLIIYQFLKWTIISVSRFASIVKIFLLGTSDESKAGIMSH